MSTEFDNNMSDILEVPNDMAPVVREEPKPLAIPKDAQDDYNYSRANYYNLIEKGNEALEGILEVAREGQHPRAYEVAGNMLKNLSDMTDKLLLLQKQKKELEGNKAEVQQVNVEKAVFVGSTSDLLKKIKNADD
jgi:hypothetical protein